MENKRLTFAFCSPFFIVLFGGKRRDTIPLCTMIPRGAQRALPEHKREERTLQFPISIFTLIK